jgi:hypothetical protein
MVQHVVESMLNNAPQRETLPFASGCSGPSNAQIALLSDLFLTFEDIGLLKAFCLTCSDSMSRMCTNMCPNPRTLIAKHPQDCTYSPETCFDKRRHIPSMQDCYVDCVQANCSCMHTPSVCAALGCHDDVIVAARPQASTEGATEMHREFVETLRDPEEHDNARTSTVAINRSIGAPLEPASTILDRAYPLPAFAVSATTSAGQTVSSIVLPRDFTALPYLPSRGLTDWHRFIRSDYKLCYKWNAPPQTTGYFIAYVRPPNAPVNPNALTSYPHTFIRFGDDACAQLVAPWMIPDPAGLPTTAACVVEVKCVVPPRFGTGVTTTVNIVPWITPQDAVVSAKVQSGKHQNVLSTILETVPELIDALPIVSDVVKTGAHIMGLFDSPAVEDEGTDRRTNSDTPRQVVKVLSSHKDAVEPDNNFTVPICTSILERCREWSYLGNFTFNTTTLTDRVLVSIPICPTRKWTASAAAAGEVVGHQLAFFAAHHQLWRGDTELSFRFIDSIFHQYQFVASYSPNPDSNDWYEKIRSLPAASFTSGSQDHEMIVRVPFNSDRDFLSPNDIAGQVLCWLQTPLAAPSTVPASVSVAVYVRAADNFELRYPCNPLYNDLAYDRPVLATPQSGVRTQSFYPSQLVPGHGLPIDDVRAICRRPSYLFRSRMDQVEGNKQLLLTTSPCVPVFPRNSTGHDTSKERNPCGVALGWMYCTGGYRTHLITNCRKNDSIVIAAVHTAVRTPYDGDWGRVVASQANVGSVWLAEFSRGSISHLNSNPSITFECPGNRIYRSACIFQESAEAQGRISGGTEILTQTMISTTPLLELDVIVAWSAADDWIPLIPIAVPPIYAAPLAQQDDLDHADGFGFKVKGVKTPIGSLSFLSCFVGKDNDDDPLPECSTCVRVPKDHDAPETQEEDFNTRVTSSSELAVDSHDEVVSARPQSGVFSRPKRETDFDVLRNIISVNPGTDRVQSFAAIDSIISLISTIRDTISSIPSAVKGIVSASTTMTAVSNSVYSAVKKSCKFFTVLFDDVLPFLTAAYTLIHGETAAKILAIASITRIVTRYASTPDQIVQGDVYQNVGVEDSACNIQSGDRPQMGFMDRNASDILIDPLHWLANSALFGWISDALSHFGFNLGPGYKKYMRRNAAILSESDRFTAFLKTVWHTLYYLFVGDSLNEEWERSILYQFTTAFSLYDRCTSTNAFDLDKLDTIIPGTSITGRAALETILEQVRNNESFLHEFRFVPAFVYARIKDITATAARVDRLLTEKVEQPEPVCIFLGGEPGTGKSLLLSKFLPTKVLRNAGIGTTPATDVYPVPVGDQTGRWDGYEGQPWVIFDEFLQGTGSEDAMSFIRAVNTVCAPIHKADLAEKGRRFRSKFVAVTSNITGVQIADNAIRCPSAVARRFYRAYRLEVCEEFATEEGRLDFQHFCGAFNCMNDGDSYSPLCDRVWDFIEIDALNGHARRDVNNQRVIHKFSNVVSDLGIEFASRHALYNSINKMLDRVQSGRGKGKASKDEGSSVDKDDTPIKATCEDILFGMKQAAPETSILFPSYVQGFVNQSDLTCGACDRFIALIAMFNDSELGFSNALLLKHMSEMSPVPFQSCVTRAKFKIVNPPSFDSSELAEIADWIWCHSTGYHASPAAKKTDWLGIFAQFAALSAVCVVGYKIVRLIMKLMTSGFDVIQSYSGTSFKKETKKPDTVVGAIPQSAEVMERIRKCVREIEYTAVDKEGRTSCAYVQVLCLDQKHIVIPNHFYQQFIDLRKAGCVVSVMLSIKNLDHSFTDRMPVYIGPDNSEQLMNGSRPIDARLVILRTEVVPRCRAIWHLVSDEQIGTFPRNSPAVVLNHSARAAPGPDFQVQLQRTAIPSYMVKEGGLCITASCVRATEDGDCGLPYCITANVPKPIVGIHTFINDDSGCIGAAPITSKILYAAKESLSVDVTVLEAEEFPTEMAAVQSKFWNSNMELVGSGKFGNWEAKHYTPLDTKFKRCTYRGIYVLPPSLECDFEPAQMRVVKVGERLVHPLITNAQKYAQRALFSPKMLHHQHAVDFYSSKWESGRDIRTLTLDEAINGVGVMQHLQLSTSAGYWSAFGFKDGKHEFFVPLTQEVDANGQVQALTHEFSPKAKQHQVPLFGESFESRLNAAELMLRNGVCPWIAWISTCKDELRHHAKVVAGKTRVFEQPPLEYVVLARKYLGSFLNYFKERAGFTLYHGIGKDKEEVWKLYWDEMNRVSHLGMDFDYGNYDGTVGQPAFQFFSDIVATFYQGCDVKEALARRCIVQMLMETYHIIGQYVSYSTKGNKSGNPFTDVFNSVTNTYNMYVAFMSTRSNANSPDLAEFDASVRMLTYGDDVVMSVRPDVLHTFNGRTIKSVMKCIGYDITSAAKTAEMEEYRPLRELTFLKTPFVVRDGVCWAPLPLQDVYKELKYRPKNFEGDDNDLRLRLLVTQRFMVHHGREALARFKTVLIEQGMPSTWLTVNYDVERQRIWSLQKEAVIY